MFPTNERLKNIIEEVKNQQTLPYNNRNYGPTTFTGVVINNTYSSCLKVVPISLLNVDSAGNLTFDMDGNNYINDNYPQDVYVQNIDPNQLQSYYSVGQIINYNLWGASGNNSQYVRGANVTICEQDGFWGQITGNTPVNTSVSSHQWTYTFTQVTKIITGYSNPSGSPTCNWAAYNGAMTGTAYNSYEDMNASGGLQGNGINVSNMGNFTYQPIPTKEIIYLHKVTVSGMAAAEFWFSAMNAIDGNCTSGGGGY